LSEDLTLRSSQNTLSLGFDLGAKLLQRRTSYRAGDQTGARLLRVALEA
jgi:hypothetical protein